MSWHDFFLLLHILGAGVVIGVVFFSLILAFRRDINPERLSVLKIIRNFGTGAVGWMLATGLVLAYQENLDGHNVFISKLFWTKMILIAVDGVLAHLIINRRIETAKAGSESELAGLRTGTLVSVLVILAVVVLGFWLTLD